MSATLAISSSDYEGLACLVPSELRVLELIAAGWTNARIAQELYLSKRTVECHVRKILLKLDLRWDDSRHPRVAAVLIYLAEAGGQPSHRARLSA
jgi:DNA-binding NarL/FixJ family response regulator